MKRYFITGTDTDCGKTYATCSLLKHFNQFKPQAFGMKPVASGCHRQDGNLISEDVIQLQAHNPLDLENINPWRFEAFCSPHLAAAYASQTLCAKAVAQYCLNFQVPLAEYLFIEGAGGLMVPLNETETWIDVLKKMRIPVVLVVGMKLGCINHAYLTATALAHHHIPCAGWIANTLSDTVFALDDILKTLMQSLPFPLLGIIPFRGKINAVQLEVLCV
jgi:dethiobiotin synthetase